jgi:hypothetical protein
MGTDEARCPYDGSPTLLVPREDDLVGTTIDGRFALTGLLGRGGMGVVYRACQLSMEREIAVKILKREHAENREAVQRFFREARAVSRLTDPHTVTVLDFGQTNDGLLFLAMEMLRGRTLFDAVRAEPGPMDPARAIRIVDQILSAVGEAHAVGVLHRDLKPENVFLVQGEETRDFVKVLDFGISKLIGEEGTPLTGAGKVFGTPAYMSPEQANGRNVDRRSDLYAVGVILFELLAGKPPFAGTTPIAILVKKATEEAPSLYHVNPDLRVPEGLERLVARLLASDPDLRPADVKETRRLLAEVAEGGDGPEVPLPDVRVRAGTTELVERVAPEDEFSVRRTASYTAEPDPAASPPPARPARRRGWTWAVVLAGAGLLGGLGVILWNSGDAPVDPPVESSTPLPDPAPSRLEPAPAAVPVPAASAGTRPAPGPVDDAPAPVSHVADGPPGARKESGAADALTKPSGPGARPKKTVDPKAKEILERLK